MSIPGENLEIQPRAIATFTALRWIGDEEDEALTWMAERYGWTILGIKEVRNRRCMRVRGRNGKNYDLANGDYIVALGANGSLRIATPKEFDRDYYRKASE